MKESCQNMFNPNLIKLILNLTSNLQEIKEIEE